MTYLLALLTKECWPGGHRKLDTRPGDFRWCPKCHHYCRCR